jgi:hypothetical protein
MHLGGMPSIPPIITIMHPITIFLIVWFGAIFIYTLFKEAK